MPSTSCGGNIEKKKKLMTSLYVATNCQSALMDLHRQASLFKFGECLLCSKVSSVKAAKPLPPFLSSNVANEAAIHSPLQTKQNKTNKRHKERRRSEGDTFKVSLRGFRRLLVGRSYKCSQSHRFLLKI